MLRKWPQLGLPMALMLAPLTAQSADLAVLQNGFSIRHERRQMMGTITRLYLRSDDSGYVDVPTDQIEGFEKDLSPPPSLRAPADPRTVSAAISSASDRHRIDPDLISSMIRAESGFNPNAVSRKGAQGLMQLMPQTASRLGVADAFDPGANVDGGTRYLRELLERYDFDLVKALAAYNAGPGKVEQYRGIPPYRETRAYVSRIIRDFNRQKLAERKVAARGSRKAKSPRPVSTANQGSQIEPVPRGSR